MFIALQGLVFRAYSFIGFRTYGLMSFMGLKV